MLGLRHLPALGAAAGIAVLLAGCGGLGVDLRSGGSGSNTANQVAITAQSGVTINPYPVEIGHTTAFVAHPSSGNVINFSVIEPVVWNSNNTGVELLEPGCKAPYGGEPTTQICVFAASKVSANVNATTSNGAVGTIVVTVDD